MEIDIYIPKYSIAFEYQGEHHFGIPNFLKDEKLIEITKIKDEKKIELCKKLGITLITIPFWWNKNKNDLISTINHYKPGILKINNNENDNNDNNSFKDKEKENNDNNNNDDDDEKINGNIISINKLEGIYFYFI